MAGDRETEALKADHLPISGFSVYLLIGSLRIDRRFGATPHEERIGHASRVFSAISALSAVKSSRFRTAVTISLTFRNPRVS